MFRITKWAAKVLPISFVSFHLFAIIYSTQASDTSRVTPRNWVEYYLHWTGTKQKWRMFDKITRFHSFKVLITMGNSRSMEGAFNHNFNSDEPIKQVVLDVPASHDVGFLKMIDTHEHMFYPMARALCASGLIWLAFDFEMSFTLMNSIKRHKSWGPIQCWGNIINSGL